MDSSDFWHLLPDPLLLYIFSHLSAKELLNARETCRNWLRVATDEFLWKRLFHNDFKIDKSIPIAPGKYSWFNEYRRLKYHIPSEQTEILVEHTHQVLHVSFAHNGKMFASSSKDGYIKVWTSTYPAKVLYSTDMKSFSWNYTQFSQFNESDSLLLVSGVHFGAHTASGEIAVFNLQVRNKLLTGRLSKMNETTRMTKVMDKSMCPIHFDHHKYDVPFVGNFALQCRVLNKPYDTFGTWYTDEYLLSGRLHFLGHLVSCSALWLNKAWQESESEKKPIVKRLFKFYNRKASSIRTIAVANCLMPESKAEGSDSNLPTTSSRRPVVHGNPVSKNAISADAWPTVRGRTIELASGSLTQDIKVQYTAESNEACTMDSPIRYSQEYRRAESADMPSDSSEEEDNTSSDFEDPLLPWDEEWSGLSDEEGGHMPLFGASSKKKSSKSHPSGASKLCSHEEDENADSLDDDSSIEKILDPREKFLIFTTGSLTYTPHQIGFKRIKPFKFAERITETPTLLQRLAEREERNSNPTVSPNWHDEETIMHYFDQVDHLIDLHGHIIGMGLSPDHRYLYVNSRPWPQGYVIDNPLTPPPIAQEIDIHVIDLCTLKEVGTMLRSHKAYTPNDECFFIFLDVSDQYVASGAEDKHGYLWDRHYGNCLSKLPHSDVVNSVAFNPKDPEMLVTASDDFTLKVWRSKNRVKELNISMEDKMQCEDSEAKN